MRARTLEVVTRLIGLCAELGGSVLVHGSPKQRAIAAGETHATARGRLIEFLADAARVAAAHGVTYCIEPLGRAETALINTVAEAAEVVRAVDSPALQDDDRLQRRRRDRGAVRCPSSSTPGCRPA